MQLRIPIILGTDRKSRQSANVAHFLKAFIEQNYSDISTEIVDVRELKLYEQGYDGDLKEANNDYKTLVENSDGFLIVVPEYNHGYPGRLKSALDLLLPEYNHKAVALAGVSSGGFGGTRVIENLLPVVRELGLVATSKDLNVSKVQEQFTEEGELKEEAREQLEKRAKKCIEELLWMSKTLKVAREG